MIWKACGITHSLKQREYPDLVTNLMLIEIHRQKFFTA
jgi:hypothetical protein